jgi:hypothetical protein
VKDSAAVSRNETVATPLAKDDEGSDEGIALAAPETDMTNSRLLSEKAVIILLKESTAVISTATFSPAVIFCGNFILK